MLISLDYIQVMNDPLRIAVSKKHLPVIKLYLNATRSPNVGLAIAHATNPHSTHWIPALNLIGFDLQQRNRLEAETQGSNLNPVAAEVVMKSIPGHREGSNHKDGDKAHRQTCSGVRNRQRSRHEDGRGPKKHCAPSLARM